MPEEMFGMYGTVTREQAEKHKADLARAEQKKNEKPVEKPEPAKPKANTETNSPEKGE